MKKSLYLLLVALPLLHFSDLQAVSAASACRHTGVCLHAGAIPGHSVAYNNAYAPAWKTNWDQGRKLFRQKKYDQARLQYRQLLNRKNNIDQARWEYISILIIQRRWREAGNELAILLAQNPRRPDYQLAKAEIALGSGEFSNAADIFSRLYRQQHNDGNNGCQEDLVRILSGYIASLEASKEFETMLPLVEELKFLRPPNDALHGTTATIAMEHNRSEKSQ